MVRDLDLGVEVGDLTFGDVDTDAAKELFAKLQFGERTRNRVLKAFNCMPVADAAQESTPDAEEEPDAVLDTVSTKDELMRWAHEHLVTVSGGREDPPQRVLRNTVNRATSSLGTAPTMSHNRGF